MRNFPDVVVLLCPPANLPVDGDQQSIGTANVNPPTDTTESVLFNTLKCFIYLFFSFVTRVGMESV